MSDSELVKIKGGISASILNAIIRGINISIELGRMVGSAIKRKLGGKKYAC